MKITLRVFAVICVLWAVSVALLPVRPPPKLESKMQQAVSDAHKVLDSHATPIDMNAESMKTNEVPVQLGTLELLVRQAEWPAGIWGWAQFFFRTSIFFALVAAMCLFLLSRKKGHDTEKSA